MKTKTEYIQEASIAVANGLTVNYERDAGDCLRDTSKEERIARQAVSVAEALWSELQKRDNVV